MWFSVTEISAQEAKTVSMTSRVAGHFLLVARVEGLDLQVREQALDLAVRQPATLDAGRGADALDGRDPPQGREAFRRQGAQGTPGSLELVDLGDEGEHLGRDLQGGCLEHHPFLHPQIPDLQPATDIQFNTH